VIGSRQHETASPFIWTPVRFLPVVSWSLRFRGAESPDSPQAGGSSRWSRSAPRRGEGGMHRLAAPSRRQISIPAGNRPHEQEIRTRGCDRADAPVANPRLRRSRLALAEFAEVTAPHSCTAPPTTGEDTWRATSAPKNSLAELHGCHCCLQSPSKISLFPRATPSSLPKSFRFDHKGSCQPMRPEFSVQLAHAGSGFPKAEDQNGATRVLDKRKI